VELFYSSTFSKQKNKQFCFAQKKKSHEQVTYSPPSTKTRPVGLEPTTSGFGDLRSTN
jgi:hypothetical protein